MILVDSSVWIELIRHPSSDLAGAMGRVVEEEAATCGIVLQEVLQGIRPVDYVDAVRQSLLRHHYLESPQVVFLKAADYTLRCRTEGLKLSTVDALIAAICAHYEARLWTRDKDFFIAARFLPIRLYQPR